MQRQGSQSKISESSSKRNRCRIRTDPTEYLFHQDEADLKLKVPLKLMLEIVCEYDIMFEEKYDKKLSSLVSSLRLLNPNHRSYSQTLVLAALTQVFIHHQKQQYEAAINRISDLVAENYETIYKSKKHLLALCLTYKIMILEKINSINEKDRKVQKQMQLAEKLLKKIKIHRIQLDPASLLWESKIIHEITIFLFQYAIKELTQTNHKKGRKLFEKGLKIAQRLLGPEHKLTKILQNIKDIKSQISAILKASSTITSTKSNTIRSINHRKQKSNRNTTTKIGQKNTLNKSQQASLKIPKRKNMKHIDPLQFTNSSWMRKKYFPENINRVSHFNGSLNKRFINAPEMNKLKVISSLYRDKAKTNEKVEIQERSNSPKKIGSIVSQKQLVYNQDKIQNLISKNQKIEEKKVEEKNIEDCNIKIEIPAEKKESKVEKSEEKKENQKNCQLI